MTQQSSKSRRRQQCRGTSIHQMPMHVDVFLAVVVGRPRTRPRLRLGLHCHRSRRRRHPPPTPSPRPLAPAPKHHGAYSPPPPRIRVPGVHDTALPRLTASQPSTCRSSDASSSRCHHLEPRTRPPGPTWRPVPKAVTQTMPAIAQPAASSVVAPNLPTQSNELPDGNHQLISFNKFNGIPGHVEPRPATLPADVRSR